MKQVFNIFIDAEWSSKDELLSVQVVVQEEKNTIGIYYLIPEKIYDILTKKNIILPQIKNVNYLIIPDNSSVIQTLYTAIQPHFQSQKIWINLQFYYSIRDLMYYFGNDFILDLIDKDVITKNNNLRGDFSQSYNDIQFHYSLKDRSGWVKTGLKALNDTLGIGHTTKDLIKDYTGFMEKCLETQERFDLFVNYGIEDVVSLSQVPTRMVSFINQISTDTLQMPKEFEFTEENIPSTIGSVVARFFQNYLLYELSSSLTDNNLKEGKDGRKLKESLDRLERIRKKMAID